MASTTYSVLDGATTLLVFRCDFAQASSPILIGGEDGFSGTPFRACDADSPTDAAKLLNAWQRNQGGECWGRGSRGLTLRTHRRAR